MHKVKLLPNVQHVNTMHEGKIVAHIKMKTGQTSQDTIYVENPHNLFQLRVHKISYEELELIQFVSPNRILPEVAISFKMMYAANLHITH